MYSERTSELEPANVGAVPVTETEEHEAEEGHLHLPPPTIWPVVSALGFTTIGMGLVSVPVVSIIGLVILIFGIVNWIQELRHEYR